MSLFLSFTLKLKPDTAFSAQSPSPLGPLVKEDEEGFDFKPDKDHDDVVYEVIDMED